MYNEIWHENEVSIVIKMLDQSMKEKDKERTIELERSLLELERKADTRTDEASSTLGGPLPSKVQSFGSASAEEAKRAHTRSETSPFSLVEEEYLRKAILQNTKQYDEQITVMLVGNCDTGKTRLMNSWLGLSNAYKAKHTLGYVLIIINSLDSKSTIRKYMGIRIRYKIIDSEGAKTKEFIRKGKG
eukprot:TRINITY_DN1004_c0_g1_i1.p1 TRINITY_DN1004_c0_g1~~TRINITY_DN1004_c0_g1_i1.p1  ORF type:complete len:187 (+),score=48.87 TRINITY_DN1004_c0_g1_i1:435-995(+)